MVLEFINIHYNDFTTFNYSANTYDLTDSNPLPTLIAGASGGEYNSTPTGLIINSITGEIDLPQSQIGNYAITYSLGPLKPGETNRYYNDTFNMELTDSTLSDNSLESLPFSMYPNPTKDIVHFKSTKLISEIKIYNTLGKLVKSFLVNTNEGSINLSTLTTGMYMTVFYDENNKRVVMKRLLKK